MLDVHWDGDPQIHLVKRTNLATEYPVGGERVVTIGINDDWYPIAANKALEGGDSTLFASLRVRDRAARIKSL
jgi:hypothetical protein